MYPESIKHSGCIECSTWLSNAVYAYSTQNFGVPLCFYCQDKIRKSKASPHAKTLYFALRMKGVPAELEKFDGYKRIDIAVPSKKLNIEVDGTHHNFNPLQALSDLQRTYYSYQKGYQTLRIPNSLVKYDLQRTVKYLVEYLSINRRQG